MGQENDIPDWAEGEAEEEKPQGKFDLETPDWADEEVIDESPSGLQQAGEAVVDTAKSIGGGIAAPLETLEDLSIGASHGNVFRQPMQKFFSGIEAGAGKLNEMIHDVPERARISFKDRLMEKFREKEALANKEYEEAGARSPVATSLGGAIGSLGGSGAVPFSGAKGLGGAGKRIGAAAGMSFGLEGFGSQEKPFDIQRASDAADISGLIQGGFEAAPPIVRAGAKAAKPYVAPIAEKAIEKVGRPLVSGAVETMARMSKTPREYLERYWNRPKEVMSAPEVPAISQGIQDTIGELKDRVSASSKAALETIPEDLQIPSNQLVAKVRAARDKIAESMTTNEDEKAVKELTQVMRRLGGNDFEEVKFPQIETSLKKLEDPLADMDEKEVMQLYGGKIGVGDPRANNNFDSNDHDDAVNWYYAHRIDDILKDGKKKVEDLSPKDRRLYDANMRRIEQHAILRDYKKEKEFLGRNLTDFKTSSGKQIPATSYKLEALDYSPKDFEEAIAYYQNLKNKALESRPNDAMRFEQPDAYKRFVANSKDEAKEYDDMAKRLAAASQGPQMTKDQFAVQRIIEQRLRNARIGKENYRDESEKLLKNLKETLGGGPMITDDFIDKAFNEEIAKRPPKAVAESRAARERQKFQTIEGGGEGSFITGRNLKKRIQSIDKRLEKGKANKLWMEPIHQEYSAIRRDMDELLKGNEAKGQAPLAPGYKEAMKPVAESTAALSGARGKFKNADQGVTRLNALANQPGKNAEGVKALKALDKEMGTNFYEQNLDRRTREHFDKNISGGAGHRFAITGGVGAMGILSSEMGLSPTEKALLAGAVGAGGFALDLFLPKLNKAAIDAARSVYNRRGMLGKYGPILEKAAAKGPTSLGLTHLILSENNPEYSDLVGSSEIRDAQLEALRQK